MALTRTRLSHAQLADLARHAFGLTRSAPDLPAGTDFEDAEGVLVATSTPDGLVVHGIPRWRSPGSVRAELEERGWSEPAAWVGSPPEDVSGLPDRLLVLLPVAGTAPAPDPDRPNGGHPGGSGDLCHRNHRVSLLRAR